MIQRNLLAAMLLLPAWGTWLHAEDVKTYTDADGVTWQEKRWTTNKLIPETKMVEQKQMVLTEEVKSDQQTTYQQYQVPITEYRWEAYWANRWNPFSQPYIAYRYVPHTRYETRTAEIKMPVTQRKYVPTERTIKVPVTTMRTVAEEHTSKVVIGYQPKTLDANGQTAVATRNTVPGQTTNTAAGKLPSGWKPGTETTLR